MCVGWVSSSGGLSSHLRSCSTCGAYKHATHAVSVTDGTILPARLSAHKVQQQASLAEAIMSALGCLCLRDCEQVFMQVSGH